MTDDKGRRVKSAGPSTPVEILGLSEVPAAGDSFYVAANEKQARQLAESVIAKNRETLISQTPQKVSLDDLFNQIQSGNMKELGIIVKADVQGSVEAVRQSLEKLTNEEVRVRVIHGGVGAVTESDTFNTLSAWFASAAWRTLSTTPVTIPSSCMITLSAVLPNGGTD